MAWPHEGEGFKDSDQVVRWRDCPDCKGRGWFLINPFATGGSNGAGGISNLRQCPTCRDAYRAHSESANAAQPS